MEQHGFAWMHGRLPLVLVLLTVAIAGNPTSVHAGEWIEGRVTHVRDIDTIEVNGLPIRLNGVDGPELDERGGTAGKRWMQDQFLNRSVRCWLTGARTYDRWVGTCHEAAGHDIGALAIAAGMARDCPRAIPVGRTLHLKLQRAAGCRDTDIVAKLLRGSYAAGFSDATRGGRVSRGAGPASEKRRKRHL